jgi:hypothetical protein
MSRERLGQSIRRDSCCVAFSMVHPVRTFLLNFHTKVSFEGMRGFLYEINVSLLITHYYIAT